MPYSLILDMIVAIDFTNFCAASIWHEMIAWWLKLKYIGYCKIRPWSKIPQIWYRKLVANGLFNQWLLVIHTFSTYLHIRVSEGSTNQDNSPLVPYLFHNCSLRLLQMLQKSWNFIFFIKNILNYFEMNFMNINIWKQFFFN